MAVPKKKRTGKFSLDRTDLVKLGKGLLIAVAGAALTYCSEWIAGADFGSWTPMVVTVWSVVVNVVRKWIADDIDPVVEYD